MLLPFLTKSGLLKKGIWTNGNVIIYFPRASYSCLFVVLYTKKLHIYIKWHDSIEYPISIPYESWRVFIFTQIKLKLTWSRWEESKHTSHFSPVSEQKKRFLTYYFRSLFLFPSTSLFLFLIFFPLKKTEHFLFFRSCHPILLTSTCGLPDAQEREKKCGRVRC